MTKVLDSLIAIKASIHETAETGVNEKLDEAIELVKEHINCGSCSDADEILVVLGKMLDRLPSIVALLKLFSD
jgi:hypothetical protein